MEDCHEIHKLGSLMPPFFFHCWFIVDSEFQSACIEIVGASVNTEATTAAAARRHDTDRRRSFFELGLLLRCGWPPPFGRRLLLPPSHCYSSTMPTWPWCLSCAFDVMLRRLKISWCVTSVTEARFRMTKSHSVWVPTQRVVTLLAKESYSENDKSRHHTRLVLASLASVIPEKMTEYLTINGAN